MKSGTDPGGGAGYAYAIELGDVQRAVHRHLEQRPATMLDAGCGARRRIGLLAEHVVGIDPDAEAIARNPCVDEKIVSSLEDAELPDGAYDIVICWNVLEHIDNPMRVLADFARAVKPGGLIVIALPNVQSFRGVVTKFHSHSTARLSAPRGVLGTRA